jgi:hypothetical protein
LEELIGGEVLAGPIGVGRDCRDVGGDDDVDEEGPWWIAAAAAAAAAACCHCEKIPGGSPSVGPAAPARRPAGPEEGAPGVSDACEATAAAAMAAPGKNPKGAGGGGRQPAISIMRAFSAAAAAIRLLFSASESKGERKRKVGSIPGGMDAYGESLREEEMMLGVIDH